MGLFDERPYGDGGTRLDIGSGEEIYTYLKDFFIPEVYDEAHKEVDANSYLWPESKQFEELAEDRRHFLNTFNYVAGVRLTYRRIYWLKNNDSNSFNISNEHPHDKNFDYKKKY